MRKIILGAVLGLVFSIGAYTSAKANTHVCSQSDPCQGWEMIQPNGDIWRIVCSESVCGSGIFDNKVVRLEPTPTPRLEPWPTFIVPTSSPAHLTLVAQERASEPSTPSAPQQPTVVEPTSSPQPAPEATSQPAPEATPAPPVAWQPTQTSVPPVVAAPTSTPVVVVVATAAPTQSPAVVVVTVVGTSSISIPSVSVTELRKTQEKQEDEEEWEPKRRRWGGEQQAI